MFWTCAKSYGELADVERKANKSIPVVCISTYTTVGANVVRWAVPEGFFLVSPNPKKPRHMLNAP
jgi:hypothetical protein